MLIKVAIFTVLHFCLNKFFLRKNILIDKKKSSKHKRKILTNTHTPLAGGLIFLIFLVFTDIFNERDFFFIFAFYLLGLQSDLNIITSPIKRILIQIFLSLFFIYFSNLQIITLDNYFLDNLLEKKFINILFTLSCLLVLINGSNFMDGLNTVVISYFLLCLVTIYFVSLDMNLTINYDLYLDLITILSIMWIFNFFGKSFLGDSGSYTISFVIGFLSIIFIYNNSNSVSQFFIALLLWFPAFENLFSIIRRYKSKKKLARADNSHLHHLVYLFLKEKKIVKNIILLNSFSGIFINIYNLILFFVASYFINNSKILLILIIFNVFVYFTSYQYLKNFFEYKNKLK